jgi:hypothetical protein
MQCLYCKKQLGLFASKKRPFCSEEHEVVHQTERTMLALRRVLDPLLTIPVKPKPILLTPEQTLPPAEGASAIVALLPRPDKVLT